MEIRTINNKNKMLKKDKRNTKSTQKKKIIENKIYEAEERLLKGIKKIDKDKEIKAIAAIKNNPKFFYSIYNRRKNRRELGPIEENGRLSFRKRTFGKINFIAETLAAIYKKRRCSKHSLVTLFCRLLPYYNSKY